jgi:amino acid transporter
VYLFIGWENSATLAEETENPRENLPRAFVTSTIGIGILYVFLACVTAIGFHNDAAAIAKSAIPFVDALAAALGTFVILAYLAGVTSIFSSLIGLTNSQARVLFNSGREGLLPRFLGRVHQTHGTPWIATTVSLVLALAIAFIFGWNIDPEVFFGQVATIGTIPIVIIYTVTNLALPVYVLKHKRAQLNVFRHIVLPVLGFLVMLLPLWGLVQPGQPAPFNMFPWIAAGVRIVSIIYGAIASWRDPSLGERLGSIIADE